MSVATVEPTEDSVGIRSAVGGLWSRYGRIINHDHRVPLRTLGLYRIAFALYLLVMNPLPDLRWIDGYPDTFHNPAPGPMMLWPEFPAHGALWFLELAMVAAAVALAIGWRTAWASMAVAVAGLTADSVYLSFGKIDHTAVLWFTPLLLAASGWGTYWSSDRLALNRGHHRRGSGIAVDASDSETATSPGWPVASVAVMLALAFLSAGAPKVARGWLSPESSVARGYFDSLYVGLGRDDLLAQTFAALDQALLWELVDWATVLLELAIAAAIWRPLALRWSLFAVWVFHLITVLVMNIPFFGPTPVYALFFLTLINPYRSEQVGSWLLANRRPLLVGLVGVAAASVAGPGLYLLSLVELLGIRLLVAEMLYFAVGMAALILLAIRSQGFTRSW